MISASPSRAHDHIRYTSVDEERKMGKRQQLDYEREELERQHEISYLKAAQDLAHARLRLQEEQERWSRTEGELACRDTYLHHPRLQSAYPDNAIETPPYNAYSYAAYAIRVAAGLAIEVLVDSLLVEDSPDVGMGDRGITMDTEDGIARLLCWLSTACSLLWLAGRLCTSNPAFWLTGTCT